MKRVEHLDLQIAIPEELVQPLGAAITSFDAEYPYRVIDPQLKENRLAVNSMDLIYLLGYVDSKSVAEMTWRRFLRDLQKALQGQLNVALSPEYQYHYKWCLTALKSLPVGRYLNESA